MLHAGGPPPATTIPYKCVINDGSPPLPPNFRVLDKNPEQHRMATGVQLAMARRGQHKPPTRVSSDNRLERGHQGGGGYVKLMGYLPTDCCKVCSGYGLVRQILRHLQYAGPFST